MATYYIYYYIYTININRMFYTHTYIYLSIVLNIVSINEFLLNYSILFKD